MRRALATLLLGSALFLFAQPASAQEAGRCVVSSSDSGSNAKAAEAARVALGGATVLQARGIDPAEIARKCPTLIVAVGRAALKAAAAATSTTPIVHAMVSSPDALVAGRTNVHGVAMDADPTKVIGTLRKAKPDVKRIGIVYDPRRTGGLVDAARMAASKLGVELVTIQAADVGEALNAYRKFETERDVDALWLLPDGTATTRESVYYALELAQWKRIPVIGLSRWYVASGALFALSPKPEAMGRRAAAISKRVLAGEAVDRVDYGGDHGLLLNRRTATRLGLDLSKELTQGAVEVIE